MTFPRYPQYKPSAVEGLGMIPEHWEVIALKRVVSLNDEVLAEETSLDFEMEYVDIASVDAVNGISTTEKLSFGEAPSRARRRVRDGDVVVSTVRTYLRAIAPIALPATNLIVSTGFAVLRPGRRLDSAFAGHLLRAAYFIDEVIARSTGVSYPSINASDLVGIKVPIPPRDEQRCIARVLNDEVGKLDALINEQQRLLELLQEKRQAIISHAVTKGLNPDAPMEYSGIEWLGEVPAHWDLQALKRVARIRYGIGEPPMYREAGVFLIRATDIHAGRVAVDAALMIDPDDLPPSRVVWLQAGDIIVVRSGAYTGDSGLVTAELIPCIAGFDMVVRSDRVQSQFLQWVFLSDYCKQGQLDLLRARAAQPHLNAEELGSCFILVPPAEEQHKITAHLHECTCRIDKLSGEAKRAIALLQERRSSLISAAVTGQIDVRGLVAQEVA